MRLVQTRMRVEEKFQDTLEDIETAIVTLYRKNRDMTGHNVLRALEAAVQRYRAIVRGHVIKPTTLEGIDLALFEAIRVACEGWQQPAGPLTAQDLLDCLRRLVGSVEFWGKQGGRQGYLEHVNKFI